ncbi:MAG: undecaprenyl-diphosphatase [Bdellovibrionales bacterium GWB1_55_8]|nr:MAG: undecaprenyl-diphosphatase [Bdellovibrionales bacterium GWB1_55_8]
MSEYWLNAAIKGIIEGVTEFLPVSSTGHLVLVRDLFPLTADPARAAQLDNLFDIVIQLPAILAIVLLYWKRLYGSAMGVLDRAEARNFWISVLAAFLPAAAIGFALKDYLDFLMRTDVVALALIIGGVILLVIERGTGLNRTSRAEEVTPFQAVKIGFFQCLAMIPGTSRSGATIIGGRLTGLSRTAAAEFSFFLALPTMAGAFTLKMAKELPHLNWAADGVILAIGSVSAFLSAWAVVGLFIRFLQRYSLSVFGWYRIVLGVLVLWFGTHAPW